jgi:hypothetical protein
LKGLDGSDPAGMASPLRRLGRALIAYRDAGMTCAQCQDELPDYVEAEMAGEDPVTLYPAVQRHLDLCAECGEIYADLLEVAWLEERGELPAPVQVPGPDLSFLREARRGQLAMRVAELTVGMVQELLATWAPDVLHELSIVAEVFQERVQELGPRLTLQPAQQLALGFGPGESRALQAMVAVFASTMQAVQAESLDEKEARGRIREAAKGAGIPGKQLDEFVDTCWQIMTSHQGDLQELAASFRELR